MARDTGSRTDSRSRRGFLRAVGGTASAATGVTLAGCGGLPFGPGADAAYYHADGPTLDVEYDAVMRAARETGYTVDEPYYVNAKEPTSGFHPAGIPELDDRLGPGYRVFGVTFFYTRSVFLELWFGPDGTTASVFDDRRVTGEFDITSLPPDDWPVPRLTLAFEMGEQRAREYVATLKQTINEGTDIPSVDVTEASAFPRTYDSLTDDATDTSASDTGGDGWYEVTLYRESERIAAVDFVVQSTKIVHRRGEQVYTIKLDRLGGFNLTLELPPGEEVPDDEYRGMFREMFADVGLPPAVIDDLAFEYTPTVW